MKLHNAHGHSIAFQNNVCSVSSCVTIAAVCLSFGGYSVEAQIFV